MNASSSREYYMSGVEIAKAISDISTLAAEVIKHSSHLQLVHGTAYQPRGMTPKFLRVQRPYRADISGYAFGKDGSPVEMIAEYGGEVLIATHHHRRHNQYVLHTLSDYVSVWVIDDKDRLISGDTARQTVQDVLFRMSQLLPDGHYLKQAQDNEIPAGELAGSSLE
ncbi:MAG: hypothetical protein ACREGE_01055 [Candidatus Microsaccharimonas sp.]